MTENETHQTTSTRFYYVYILICSDANYYTGCTSNLKERFNRHQKGWVDVTSGRRPVQLVWCCAFPDRSLAFTFEKYLKSGSGRAFAKKHLLDMK